MFPLRLPREKYGEGLKELHSVFLDLEKAYDGVPRKELWYCLRKSGVAEKYMVVGVRLHQGLVLITFSFAVVIDRLTDEVRL